MRLLRDIRTAFGLLTIVPVPADDSVNGDGGDTAAMFPLVGFVFGLAMWLVVAGVLLVEKSIGGDGLAQPLVGRIPLLPATLVVIAWGVSSRFLHWDGLGDVGDAWWGGYSTERRLEIMADSSLGAFGVTTIVMTFGLYVTALGASLQTTDSVMSLSFLLAIPLMGRMSATFAAWLGVPARSDGLGRSIMGRPTLSAALVTLLVVMLGLAPAAYHLGIAGLVWCGSMLVIAAAVPHVISLRMGGVTGDVMGASVLVTEVLVTISWLLVGWF